LLRVGGERRGQRAQREPAEERAPMHHRMISSARTSSDWGIIKPNTVAVLRLITNSHFVGCSTGRSAGLAPLRILSTKVAVRRNRSKKSAEQAKRPPARA